MPTTTPRRSPPHQPHLLPDTLRRWCGRSRPARGLVCGAPATPKHQWERVRPASSPAKTPATRWRSRRRRWRRPHRHNAGAPTRPATPMLATARARSARLLTSSWMAGAARTAQARSPTQRAHGQRHRRCCVQGRLAARGTPQRCAQQCALCRERRRRRCGAGRAGRAGRRVRPRRQRTAARWSTRRNARGHGTRPRR